MARKEVDVCDFGIGKGLTCPSLAAGKCALCGRDACPSHLYEKINVRVALQSEASVEDGAVLACFATVKMPLCQACWNCVTESTTGERFAGGRVQEFVVRFKDSVHEGAKAACGPILEGLKAYWAERALTKGTGAGKP